MLETVADHLDELQYYRGGSLKGFYKQQQENIQLHIDDSRETASKMKRAPPIFSALEQKRQTLIRQKRLAKKSKPVETYISSNRGVGGTMFQLALEFLTKLF